MIPPALEKVTGGQGRQVPTGAVDRRRGQPRSPIRVRTSEVHRLDRSQNCKLSRRIPTQSGIAGTCPKCGSIHADCHKNGEDETLVSVRVMLASAMRSARL
ncbi:hypothetical protein [Humisphaera borealis]|uniref:Uncharacterized protein n=1 Tax=Humisphaera borealis TaxID=2807512 RepID=A0A7M2WPW0_9BACT|nr:hypothetical protein [Humisphaera borealis]QOV87294.1 hypothetical protein IPV69_13430 [Humisphaera borealis]